MKKKSNPTDNISEVEIDEISEDELECDLSAYTLFYEGGVGSACLSFDILKDEFGAKRNCNNPVQGYIIAGTQAEDREQNKIILAKLNKLKMINQDAESEDEMSDDEEKAEAIRYTQAFHEGCVNRIRATKVQNCNIAATWSDSALIQIYNLDSFLNRINKSDDISDENVDPIFKSKLHKVEGYAIDWSPTKPGTLCTGDCNANIFIWEAHDGSEWRASDTALRGHTASVEDIQWSPNEANVFASCSVDKSIRIWDSRCGRSTACQLVCDNAHTSDINVIHWNRMEPFIASGGDDAITKIWDLRKLQSKNSVGELLYHKGPITSIEWHPTDSSVVATCAEDDQLLQWDLAVERDGTAVSQGESSSEETEEETKAPEQLLFVHKGQQEIKELHWHPQIPGLIICTALSGFNIFKTISV